MIFKKTLEKAVGVLEIRFLPFFSREKMGFCLFSFKTQVFFSFGPVGQKTPSLLNNESASTRRLRGSPSSWGPRLEEKRKKQLAHGSPSTCPPAVFWKSPPRLFVLCCFVFFCCFFSGGGGKMASVCPWSLQNLQQRYQRHQPTKVPTT